MVSTGAHDVRHGHGLAVDDEHSMRLLRLFNEEEGREYLSAKGVRD